jgi:uroporphyrinogen decarboxylase
MPRYKPLVELIHSFGAKAMIHICGGIRELLPDIIETGFDIYDVVQVSSAGMAIERLKEDFGDEITFAGTMCVQTTLPRGSLADVKREVTLRQELFQEGGLILGPTHAIQAYTPIENILEMYRAAGSLRLA